MRRFTPFQLVVFGFLGGIFIAEGFLQGISGVEWFILGVVLTGWLAAKLRLKFLWLVAGILFGVWRFLVSIPDLDGLEELFTQKIQIQGTIVEEVDRRTDYQNLILDVPEMPGNVLVKVGRYPEYQYGDEVRVYGEIKEPFETEEFSYKNYLARYGVYATVYYPRAERISNAQSPISNGGFWGSMFWFKGEFERVLNEVFPEPSGSLAAGILLGSRRGIPAEVQEYFRITGLSHIVAISGYNITIVIAFVGAMLKWLPKRRQIVVAGVFVVLFTLFVGASAAVVRASIMGVIALGAVWFGRKAWVDQSMLMAALIMNLWNPKILVWDVGFQLSFMATLGLIYVSPLLEGWVEKRLPLIWRMIPESFCIRESIFLTCSAQVTALPIILLSFGQLSLVSPIANMMVAALIPWGMLWSFAAAIIYTVGLKGIGLIVGYCAWFFLEAVVYVAARCSAIPFASVGVGALGSWFVGIYYVGVYKVVKNS